MPDRLQLRAWRNADAQATLALFRETVRAVNSKDYDPAQIAAWASDEVTAESWRLRLGAGQAWVAEHGGSLAGFISLTPDGVVDLLFVAKNRQGEGIASALLAKLESFARARGDSELIADASITARPFFEARGFALAAEQDVSLRGQIFRNYRMTKTLD